MDKVVVLYSICDRYYIIQQLYLLSSLSITDIKLQQLYLLSSLSITDTI
jgi:hypothetical protein